MSDQEKLLLLKVKRLGIMHELLCVLDEYDNAIGLHPAWPKDMVHGAAIVAEEAGETVRAALQFHYESWNIHEVSNEAKQTAVTCLRLMNHINLPFKINLNHE